jgi:hypothetical protein
MWEYDFFEILVKSVRLLQNQILSFHFHSTDTILKSIMLWIGH